MGLHEFFFGSSGRAGYFFTTPTHPSQTKIKWSTPYTWRKIEPQLNLKHHRKANFYQSDYTNMITYYFINYQGISWSYSLFQVFSVRSVLRYSHILSVRFFKQKTFASVNICDKWLIVMRIFIQIF